MTVTQAQYLDRLREDFYLKISKETLIDLYDMFNLYKDDKEKFHDKFLEAYPNSSIYVKDILYKIYFVFKDDQQNKIFMV